MTFKSLNNNFKAPFEEYVKIERKNSKNISLYKNIKKKFN